MFYVAIVLLISCVILLGVDIFVLFKNTNIKIHRDLASIFSLGDQNKVSLTVVNNANLNLNLKIIDEIPYQFNERDFSIQILMKNILLQVCF